VNGYEKFLSMAVMKAKKTVSGCSRPRRRSGADGGEAIATSVRPLC
jgi:hypothetical protein